MEREAASQGKSGTRQPDDPSDNDDSLIYPTPIQSDDSDGDPDLEGYDESQRAEVLEAEQTDPYDRPLIHNLMPDEEGAPLPDDNDAEL